MNGSVLNSLSFGPVGPNGKRSGLWTPRNQPSPVNAYEVLLRFFILFYVLFIALFICRKQIPTSVKLGQLNMIWTHAMAVRIFRLMCLSTKTP